MAFTKTQQFGGNGGNSFSDDLTEVCRLASINIRSGSHVDMIQAVWQIAGGAILSGPSHGGTGGTLSKIELEKGELINRVEVRAGTRVDQLTFYTTFGRKWGPYGGNGGDLHVLEHLSGITGFVGGSGTEIDRIGFWVPGTCP